jgi:hypothetical protein
LPLLLFTNIYTKAHRHPGEPYFFAIFCHADEGSIFSQGSIFSASEDASFVSMTKTKT